MTTQTTPYDLIVIGGGPAGVTAALRARELGATVALVERSRLGGTCTNDGCAPTRVLAKAARLLRDTGQFATYGLDGARPTLDFGRLLSRTQQVVYTLHEKKQLADHLRASGVALFTETGDAAFVDPHTIATADGLRLHGERFVLCVGGHARRLGFPGAEHALTHSDVWSLKQLPPSVAVIGAAATGCQLASVFLDFGVRVTLLDAAPRILPGEDAAVSAVVAAAFREQGMQVVTGIGYDTRIEPRAGGLRLHYSAENTPRHTDVAAVVLAVGWPGNIEPLRLDAAGVTVERGYITVDDTLRTSAPHIFAAGDITGRMMLVQSGQYEARIAAENAVGSSPTAYAHHIVPHGGFTDPEYGSVGLTEEQVPPEQAVAVATVPYAALDRAVIDGLTTGFCKLIVDTQTQLIVGAHVVGEQALEVVQLVAAGMAAGMRVTQLAELEIAYPTYTAVVGLAARQIVRRLGLIDLTPQWRALKGMDSAEWERYNPPQP